MNDKLTDLLEQLNICANGNDIGIERIKTKDNKHIGDRATIKAVENIEAFIRDEENKAYNEGVAFASENPGGF